jgi:hypothetical protein
LAYTGFYKGKLRVFRMHKLRNIAIISVSLISIPIIYFLYETRVRNIDLLPQKLGNAKVLYSCRHWGIQETSNYHIFEIEEGIAQQIIEKGTSYFEGDNQSRDISLRNKGSHYSEWLSTPVPKKGRGKETSFAWSAMTCGNKDETTRILSNTLHDEMKNSNGYYITANSRSMFTVVFPKKRLAAYLHYWP